MLWGWLDGIVDKLTTLKESILSIPELIIDGIKEIFVPDEEYIESQFDAFVREMKMKFGFDDSFFTGIFTAENPVSDIYSDYSIQGVGTFTLKLLDTKFFVDGVTYFRPIIRGFLVLLMALYNIRQLISFFGYDAGVVAGRSDSINESRKEQRK